VEDFLARIPFLADKLMYFTRHGPKFDPIHGIATPALRNAPEPNGVLGDDCFSMCMSLQIVSFWAGSKLTSIPDSAFMGCVALESIILPSSVKTLGIACFFCFRHCRFHRPRIFGSCWIFRPGCPASFLFRIPLRFCHSTKISNPDPSERFGPDSRLRDFSAKERASAFQVDHLCKRQVVV
jgi:hypothetical protein